MQTMKKMLTLGSIFALVLVLTACGQTTPPVATQTTDATTATNDVPAVSDVPAVIATEATTTEATSTDADTTQKDDTTTTGSSN